MDADPDEAISARTETQKVSVGAVPSACRQLLLEAFPHPSLLETQEGFFLSCIRLRVYPAEVSVDGGSRSKTLAVAEIFRCRHLRLSLPVVRVVQRRIIILQGNTTSAFWLVASISSFLSWSRVLPEERTIIDAVRRSESRKNLEGCSGFSAASDVASSAVVCALSATKETFRDETKRQEDRNTMTLVSRKTNGNLATTWP